MSERPPSPDDVLAEKGYHDETIENAYVSERTPEETAKMEKRILLKTDLRILPLLAILFLFSFLDRVSIGNAKGSFAIVLSRNGGREGAIFSLVGARRPEAMAS
jgi:hypothetical protein